MSGVPSGEERDEHAQNSLELRLLAKDNAERAEAAEAEVRQLREWLRRAIRAYDAIDEGTKIDERMGYPLPGDSATSAALALHADETFMELRALLATSPPGGGGAK